MMWLDRTCSPARLTCAYCETVGEFLHYASFNYADRDYALFRCPECGSLHYDPPDIVVRIEHPYSDAYKENTRIGVKYFLEAGYSAEWIAMCALAALAGLSKEALAGRQFVDIGAGIGLSSLFVRDVCGIPPVAIEPAYMGEIGRDLLGLDIQRAFFEDLPADIMAQLRARPCLLHLNSVIEHLIDPAEPVRQALAAVEVDVFAAIVPDADAVDTSQPFAIMVPTLAPGDHLHIPTRAGMLRFMRRLGFAHCEVMAAGALLIAVGARRPILLPSAIEVERGADALLRRLMVHPDPTISTGAAARLLALAVQNPLHDLRDALRDRLSAAIDRPTVLARLNGAFSWDDMPFHIVPTCFALARDAMDRHDLVDALAWLDVVEAATVRISRDHLAYSVRSIDYKWTSRLFRAHALVVLCRFADARAVLDSIAASHADTDGAAAWQIASARADRARMDSVSGLLLRFRFGVIRPILQSWVGARRAAAYTVYYSRYARYQGQHYVRYPVHFYRNFGGYSHYYGGYWWECLKTGLHNTGVMFALLPGRSLVALRLRVARNRGSAPVRALAAIARRFLRAADNRGNVDVASNGEVFVLRALIPHWPGAVLDIGARDGRYSAIAARLAGVSAVHAFEADPAERIVFNARCAGLATVQHHDFLPANGDAWLATGLPGPIAMLRIATAGREPALLRGFAETLASGRVGAVSFAHGIENVAEGTLLRDLVTLLEGYGFTTFHLLPDGLQRCTPVPPEMEDFGGRRFVALASGLAMALGDAIDLG